MGVIPEKIIHTIEESEYVEIRTRWHNFDIKIKASSPYKAKETADEIVRLFTPSEMAQQAISATDDETTKIKLRPRGA